MRAFCSFGALRHTVNKETMGNSLVKMGIPGLDEVLLGGLPRNNNVIVEGQPGSGKTTLGLGFIHAGAARYASRARRRGAAPS